ncbi:acyl carrier protein [Bradyrhizobium sp. WD16]|uniref:acyl carrier protein n=1 Tax=Bradyrhizobium sp. WD16 TaxID=1521768 RepID=UPI0020A48A36|nr:phosphopantetheine-binding protein [Bradyrhizobium sp. WD16]
MTDLVVKVIAKKKQLDEDSISLESIMKESDEEPNLGLDSLDFVEILMELEALLKIEIPLEKVQSARTVGDLISFVSTLAKSREYETGSTE